MDLHVLMLFFRAGFNFRVCGFAQWHQSILNSFFLISHTNTETIFIYGTVRVQSELNREYCQANKGKEIEGKLQLLTQSRSSPKSKLQLK